MKCIFELMYKILDSQSLLEMGTKDLTFVQLNQLIGRKTGGISVYPFTSSVRGKANPCSHIVVRGKAMAERAEDLFNLVSILSILNMNNPRMIYPFETLGSILQ